MELGSRIKRLRKELDLTQAEFAARIGSVQNTVTGYESGRRNPSTPVISLICREFNVREEWLRDGTGEMFKDKPSSALDALSEEYGLSNAAYVMIEKFVNLKPEAQETIFNYVREVAAAFQSGEVSPSAPASPATDFTKLSIEEKVELYRRELEREEEAKDNKNNPYAPAGSVPNKSIEFVNKPDVHTDAETLELEKKYKKSRSNPVSKTTSSASSIIKEKGEKKHA